MTDERQRTLTLDSLGGHLPVRDWSEATWSGCVDCSDTLFGPLDEREATYDGEPLVCLDEECGLVHCMSADSEGWSVIARTDLTGRWLYLTPAALAALREALL